MARHEKKSREYIRLAILVLLGFFLFILYTNLTGKIVSTDSRSGVAIVKTAESGENTTNTTPPYQPPQPPSTGGSSGGGGGGSNDYGDSEDYNGPSGNFDGRVVNTISEPFDMAFDISVKFIEGVREAYEYQNFTVEREGIVKVTLESGRGLVAKLKIINTGDISISFNVTSDVKYLTIDNPTFTLKPKEEYYLIFNFLSPKGEAVGTTYGSITFNYETGRKTISVVRKIISRNFLQNIPSFTGLPPPFKEGNLKAWADWGALVIAYLLVGFIFFYVIWKTLKFFWDKIKKLLKIGEYKYISS